MNIDSLEALVTNFFYVILASLLLVVMVVIDIAVLPGHNVPLLFAIPVLYVGMTKSPRVTTAVAALAVGLDLLSLLVEPSRPATWLLALVVLCLMGYWAINVSLMKHQRDQREQQYQASVRLVEQIRQPLTVIVGRAHLLRHQCSTTHKNHSLDAIDRSTLRIEEILRTVVSRGRGGRI